MLDEVREAFDESLRQSLFAALQLPVTEFEDLEGFENFVYGVGDRVVRITHDSHRTREQLTAELAFVDHLASGGAPVSRPLPLPNGELVFSQDEFHACLFERVRGDGFRFQEMEEHLIRRWGQAIGQFHRLARGFVTTPPRPDWQEDENHRFSDRIPPEQVRVLDRASSLMQRLKALSTAPDRYGLIHSDAHAGNFIQRGDDLVFFDFDDCLYAWFGYDLATILFGVVLHPLVEETESARNAAAERFLPPFVEGYATENDPADLYWPAMQDLLKLREFSLYAVIYAHMDPDNLTDWYPRKFMAGRRERLEEDQPFLSLDLDARFG